MNDVRLSNLRPTERCVDTAINRVRLEINKWSVLKFMLHCNTCVPLFYANSVNETHEMYMTVEVSIIRVLELHIYQFKRTQYVKDFLKICYDVCNTPCGKHNAIFILGESNAGKTQFTDALTAFFLNRGEMRNPIRQERFSSGTDSRGGPPPKP